MALAKAAEAVRAAPAGSVPEVLAIMDAVDAALDEGDGVVWFSRLYRKVTQSVADALRGGIFEDGPFVDRLDVVFANYCFKALREYLNDPTTAPSAWAPLFACNERRGLARVQFALAGMNAHINRDLMRAVVDTCDQQKIEPHRESKQKRDFDKLNPLLSTIEGQTHDVYLKDDGVVFDEVENVVSTWSLEKARTNAWMHAEGLWAIRGNATLADAYLAGIDKFVGFTNRQLLTPLPKRSCLGRLLVRARALRAEAVSARPES